MSQLCKLGREETGKVGVNVTKIGIGNVGLLKKLREMNYYYWL